MRLPTGFEFESILMECLLLVTTQCNGYLNLESSERVSSAWRVTLRARRFDSLVQSREARYKHAVRYWELHELPPEGPLYLR